MTENKSADTFHTLFRTAVINSVIGTITVPVQMGMGFSHKLTSAHLTLYLNMHWHVINKKMDSEVVGRYAKLLEFNIIKGIGCLINMIHTLGQNILAKVDHKELATQLNALSSMDKKLAMVLEKLSAEFDKICPKSIPECAVKCSDSYNGTNFFKTA